MANGMEMLVNAAVKAIGINPEELKAQAHEAFTMFQQFTRDVSTLQQQVARIEQALPGMEARIISAISGDLILPDDALLSVVNLKGVAYGMTPSDPLNQQMMAAEARYAQNMEAPDDGGR